MTLNKTLNLLLNGSPTLNLKKPNIFLLRKDKIKLSREQSQRFILEGFDGIEPNFADDLLKTHKTLMNIFNKVLIAQNVKDLKIPRLPKKAFEQNEITPYRRLY